MQSRSTPSAAAEPILERLRRAAVADPAAAAQEIDAALDASAALDPLEVRSVDELTVQVLGSATPVGALLERIGLDRLAGLFERAAARVGSDGRAVSLAERSLARGLLDLARQPSVLGRIEVRERDAWSRRLLAAIDAADFTVGALFEQRVRTYGSRVLFQLTESGGARVLSWRRTATRVEAIARGLLALEDGGPARVAIVSDNRIEAVLVDLACLTCGIVDVMIPASATEADIAFMLHQAQCTVAVVSGAERVRWIVDLRERVPSLRHVVSMDRLGRGLGRLSSLDDVVARGNQVPAAAVAERAETVRTGDLATIMFTSGTTGSPKGICFSQRNLVHKRFARALALPDIV